MRKRLEQVLSAMPCDNLDDPREVAQNEMFAEEANMELAEWGATVGLAGYLRDCRQSAQAAR
jgi:hypothetical protein